jgi:hypothetical protein
MEFGSYFLFLQEQIKDIIIIIIRKSKSDTGPVLPIHLVPADMRLWMSIPSPDCVCVFITALLRVVGGG